jgi:hypothetical protein
MQRLSSRWQTSLRWQVLAPAVVSTATNSQPATIDEVTTSLQNVHSVEPLPSISSICRDYRQWHIQAPRKGTEDTRWHRFHSVQSIDDQRQIYKWQVSTSPNGRTLNDSLQLFDSFTLVNKINALFGHMSEISGIPMPAEPMSFEKSFDDILFSVDRIANDR